MWVGKWVEIVQGYYQTETAVLVVAQKMVVAQFRVLVAVSCLPLHPYTRKIAPEADM